MLPDSIGVDPEAPGMEGQTLQITGESIEDEENQDSAMIFGEDESEEIEQIGISQLEPVMIEMTESSQEEIAPERIGA